MKFFVAHNSKKIRAATAATIAAVVEEFEENCELFELQVVGDGDGQYQRIWAMGVNHPETGRRYQITCKGLELRSARIKIDATAPVKNSGVKGKSSHYRFMAYRSPAFRKLAKDLGLRVA